MNVPRVAIVSIIMTVGVVLGGALWFRSVAPEPSQLGPGDFRAYRPPPGFTRTCFPTITEGCVRRVARRVGHEVAWLDPQRPTSLEGIVFRGQYAGEQLRFPQAAGSLDSASLVSARFPSLPAKMHKEGTYEFRRIFFSGAHLMVRQTGAGEIGFTKVSWIHDGETSSLGITNSIGVPPRVDFLLNLWRSVRYVS